MEKSNNSPMGKIEETVKLIDEAKPRELDSWFRQCRDIAEVLYGNGDDRSRDKAAIFDHFAILIMTKLRKHDRPYLL